MKKLVILLFALFLSIIIIGQNNVKTYTSDTLTKYTAITNDTIATVYDPFFYTDMLGRFNHGGFNYWYYVDPFYYNSFFFDDFYYAWDYPFYFSFGYPWLFNSWFGGNYGWLGYRKWHTHNFTNRTRFRHSPVHHNFGNYMAQHKIASPNAIVPKNSAKNKLIYNKNNVPSYQIKRMPARASYNNSKSYTQRIQASTNNVKSNTVSHYVSSSYSEGISRSNNVSSNGRRR